MKQDKIALRQKILQELIRNLPEEEAEKLRNMDEYQVRVRIMEYYQSQYPNQSSMNTGSYNMDGAKVDCAMSFSPSLIARSSFLYLQALAGLTFPETHYTTRQGMPSHLLLETMSGAGYLEYEGTTQELYPGDIIFLDCRKNHHYRAYGKTGWGYRLAHFSGAIMADLYGRFLQSKCFCFHASACRAVHSFVNRLFEVNMQDSENQELLSNCLLTQIVTELSLQCPSVAVDTPEWIQNIRSYLDQHHHEMISLDSIAKECNISKYYMCHSFKRYTGQTIQQYITDQRMHSAQELLHYTNLSIAEIALLVGFENASSFGKLFHKKTGATPGAYRKQSNQDK